MLKRILITSGIVFVTLAAVACGAETLRSNSEWEEGGYIAYAQAVWVTDNEKALAPEPGAVIPADWQELSENSVVNLQAGKKIQFVVCGRDDTRYASFSFSGINVKDNSIKLIVSQMEYTGYRQMDKMSEPWNASGIVDGLAKGEYDVFLYKTFIGKIKVF